MHVVFEISCCYAEMEIRGCGVPVMFARAVYGVPEPFQAGDSDLAGWRGEPVHGGLAISIQDAYEGVSL